MGEPYLEKAERTGRLIVPSKLGAVPDEAYDMELHELSLAGARALSLPVENKDHATGAPSPFPPPRCVIQPCHLPTLSHSLALATCRQHAQNAGYAVSKGAPHMARRCWLSQRIAFTLWS
jgi:hypothetical protein